MKTKTTLTAMTVAMMLTAPAFAHDMSKNDKMEWKTNYYISKIDTNGDGSISKAEHDAFGNKMFTSADTNKDGKISKAELIAEKKKEKADMKAAMDK